jgi:hypothetical protein
MCLQDGAATLPSLDEEVRTIVENQISGVIAATHTTPVAPRDAVAGHIPSSSEEGSFPANLPVSRQNWSASQRGG